MGLRARTLTILAISICFSVAATILFSKSVLQNGFQVIEERDVQTNALRVQEAIQSEIEMVSHKIGDWSAWDDSYQFVKDGNKAFIESNLSLESFEVLKLNLMVFVNLKGKIVWARWTDAEFKTFQEIPPSIKRLIESTPAFTTFSSLEERHKGLLQSELGTLIFTSQPILTSKNEGPTRGTIFAGRIAEGEVFARISSLTHLTTEFSRWSNSDKAPAAGELASLQFIDEHKLAAIFPFKDFFGQPILTVRVEVPRDVYQQAKLTLGSFYAVLAAFGLTFLLIVLGVIDRLVLRKISSLRTQLLEIEKTKNFSNRIEVEGKDEFATLASVMNNTFSSLEEAQGSTKRLLDNAGQGFLSFSAEGIIHPQFSKKVVELWNDKLAGNHISDLFKDSKDAWDTRLYMTFSGLLPFEDCVALFPNEIRLDKREIELRYKPILDSKDKLVSIMAVATDITQLKDLQRKREFEQQENRALLKILANKDDYMDLVQQCKNLGAHTDPIEFMRELHSLKGGFAVLSCENFVNLCHEWESRLKKSYSPDAISSCIQELNAHLSSFIERHDWILNMRTDGPVERVNIDINRILSLIDLAVASNASPNIIQSIEEMMERPASEALANLSDAFVSSATRLNKVVNPIQWTKDCGIAADLYRGLLRSLVHIPRNSAVHGIEKPDDRLDRGKNRIGNLYASIEVMDGNYVLRFTDDGQGINLERARARIRQMGDSRFLNDLDVVEYLWKDGFSTKSEEDLLAGRGFGLGAIAAEIRKLGGDYHISTVLGKSTTVTLKFPRISRIKKSGNKAA